MSADDDHQKIIKKCIGDMRKLLLDDSKLKDWRTEDKYLLRFLHCTNFDVDLAFTRLKNISNLFLEHPSWFPTTSPLDKKDSIERSKMVMLSQCDKQGRRIFVCKLEFMDVDSTPAEQALIIDMWLESIMDDPRTQSTGVCAILDMNGYSLKLFRWLTPSNIKIAARKIDLYPLKEVLIHVVNTSFLLNASVKLIWPFFNKKLKNMLKFNFNDWSALHEHISPELLPSEYGGTGPDINYEESYRLLFEQNSQIESNLKFYQTVLTNQL